MNTFRKWSGWAVQYPGKLPKLFGAREIAELNHSPDEGARLIYLQESELEQVDKLFVPGVMHCAKCKFKLVRTVLSAGDGNTYAGGNETEPCPNGCGPLWPWTWEQEARQCWERAEAMFEDTRMIDWLESNNASVKTYANEYKIYSIHTLVANKHNSLRQLITHAMKGK